MPEEKEFCPNCEKEIKIDGGFLSKPNPLMAKGSMNVIKEYSEETEELPEKYCQSCGSDILNESIRKLRQEKNEIKDFIKNNISKMPIVTSDYVPDWTYRTLKIVTGQSTTGTGIFSEVGGDISDFFGVQSNSHNKKLKEGENKCFNEMRSKALKMGGNAIISTDIDYSEIGGSNNMLMVCAGGTAVNVEEIYNHDDMSENENWLKIVKELKTKANRLNELENLDASIAKN